MTKMWRNLIVLFISTWMSSHCFASRPYPFPKPKDFSNLKVYLLTVGLGEDLYMRYGHTLLYLVNEEINYSAAYNWGMFSFNDPDFAQKFFQGTTRYWVDQDTLSGVIKTYEVYEDRQVLQNELLLSNFQKKKFIGLLDENFKGDNIFFSYDYFYENCATYPRDHLNASLGGALKESWQNIPATKSLRNYVRDNLNSPFYIGFLLDVIMNWNIDIKINSWVEAYYPKRLQQLLAMSPRIDDFGNPVQGTSLLGPTEVLVQAPLYPPSPLQFGWVFLAGFLLLPFCLLGLFRASGLKRPKLSWFTSCLIRLNFSAYLMISGAFGLLMTFGFFSNVQDIRGNWNLMLFWPTDLIAAAVVLIGIFYRPAVFFWRRTAAVYFMTHLTSAGVWLVLFVFGMISQNVNQVVTFIFPALLTQVLVSKYVSQQVDSRSLWNTTTEQSPSEFSQLQRQKV